MIRNITNKLAETLIKMEFTLQVQVITKKGDKCRSTLMTIKQDNVYLTGSVDENFSGQPIIASGNTGTEDIDCKRAYEFKKQ